MLIVYLSAAILAGLAVFVVILGFNSIVAAGSEVDDRLSAYATMSATFGASAENEQRIGERFNGYLNERGFLGSIGQNLARADAKITISEFLILKLTLVLVPFAIFWLFTGMAISGMVAGFVCFVLPDLWLRMRERRRSFDFALQLPDTLSLVVGGLRAGFSLQQALLNVSKEAPEPTSSEFKRLGQELQLGVPLIEALDGLVRRIQSPDLEMIVSVFKIHSRVGGNLAAVLDTVGMTIRERVRLRREIRVITAQQRYASYVLGGLPPILGVILFLINPDYMMSMFEWSWVMCIPVGAAISTVVGFLVIRKIVDIKI